MADRFRIDWENLEAPPRKKREGATREDLAARKFNIGKAHHKGRCHITNQKRRQIAQERAKKQAKTNQQKASAFRDYKNQVAAFWRGETDEHP